MRAFAKSRPGRLSGGCVGIDANPDDFDADATLPLAGFCDRDPCGMPVDKSQIQAIFAFVLSLSPCFGCNEPVANAYLQLIILTRKQSELLRF
jgi:hypothetical protein